jgi:Xaa-Pro aminopeptidase
VSTGLIDLASLPRMDLASRAAQVRAALAARDMTALLVSDLVNVRWLTGFTGSAGRAVVLPDELVLVVDGRYVDQAGEQLAANGVEATVRTGSTQAALLAEVAAALGPIARLAIEAGAVTLADHAQLRAGLPVDLVETDGVVEGERRTKDPGEVARIEAAATIASHALADVIALLEQGPTEREVELALDRRMEDLGAEGPSFPTIVASGPNAAKPHHRPGNRRLVEGDCVVLDYGALYDGYHSDMTRTAVLGTVDPWLSDAFAAVEAAQQAGVDAVRAGLSGRDLDRACREPLTVAGYGANFTHGTGHGVGLRIHETPFATLGSNDQILLGDVVTVEPGVYRGDLGGVRIEDSVVVTTDGCRPLTHTPKDLSCLRSPRTT